MNLLKKPNTNSNSAEHNLFDMVKNNKNKHAYVSTKLNELSNVINKIDVINDKEIVKYLITLTCHEFSSNTFTSNLSLIEQSHLRNAFKTRCVKKAMKYY